jgi:hypothetical protein
MVLINYKKSKMVFSDVKSLNIFIVLKFKCFCLLSVISRNILSIYSISVIVI